jgi:hypothetical protein
MAAGRGRRMKVGSTIARTPATKTCTHVANRVELSFLLMVYIALQLRRIAIALETANRIPPLLPETQEIKVRYGAL